MGKSHHGRCSNSKGLRPELRSHNTRLDPAGPRGDAYPEDEHRGISYSVVISIIALVLLWRTPIKDAWIGVVFGHLFMDSLTMMGVPLLDERSRRITIFGEKLRTGSPGEFVLTGIIAFVAFIVLGSFILDTERRNWQELYRKGIADRKEYYTNRFNFF